MYCTQLFFISHPLFDTIKEKEFKMIELILHNLKYLFETSFEVIIYFILLCVGHLILFRFPKMTLPSTPYMLKDVSIIVPARNEYHRIRPLLESLKKEAIGADVIIVDDQSDDGTGALASSYGFKVVVPNEKPKGWHGKPWALHSGVMQSKGRILLFLDADTRIESGGIQKLIHYFLNDETPLSVQPFHEMKRPYERLSLLFNLIVVMAANTFTIFQSKVKPRAFFGPTQVMLRAHYDEFATQKSVTGKVLEDIYLGKSFLKGGLKIRALTGKDVVSFRMYPDGIKDVLNGFGKNFASGAMAIGVVSSLLISLWLTGMYASFVNFFRLIMEPSQVIPYFILTILYGVSIYKLASKIGNFGILTIVLYPLHALFFLYVFIYSFFRIYIFKSNTWKGRKVS
jgi:4,4'-diaponeurosporenoate glycosyltransferase